MYQIQADPIKLHQIFSNLIGNAIKFTSHGGFIDISTSNPTDDAFVVISKNLMEAHAGCPPRLTRR